MIEFINITHTFQAGVYDIILDGAAGGQGCDDGLNASEGGNGARFRCRIRFKKTPSINVTLGETPPHNNCTLNFHRGGYPYGGSSGEDIPDGNDASGGGGGLTYMSFENTIFVAVGAGAGGYHGTKGSDGGGQNYTVKILDNDRILEKENIIDDENNFQGVLSNPYLFQVLVVLVGMVELAEIGHINLILTVKEEEELLLICRFSIHLY
ncbi:hypothetical protein TVAG_462860 [Trichomonas vaginalis G3]|uniref:receptor protein-tyrosine kinase n=1 Tax=Trichomonas vaginalis (strain ATCC PRA-98 / G3) TaxID=412133 RepID=A2DLZ7_TRIV3|nr:serine-type endopeptidase protein [Trichomonas vaginalis G3]EAY18600.1 hypothetical protein TVAG_462860 [Trichomonas vaginalis G3]KAI5491632.1 serine-type endopeptidase protein [Trichomonas vaginalis G3]|eukprot:XP_001579586.1 hypothetical protein [Trichomonas vaginalis G3]